MELLCQQQLLPVLIKKEENIKNSYINYQQTNNLESLIRNKRDGADYRRNQGFGTFLKDVTKNNPVACPPGQGCEVLGDAGGHFIETAKGIWNHGGKEIIHSTVDFIPKQQYQKQQDFQNYGWFGGDGSY